MYWVDGWVDNGAWMGEYFFIKRIQQKS